MPICFIIFFLFLSPLFAENKILDQLLEGNKRFQEQKMNHCYSIEESRKNSAVKQKPIAAIVSCSDSRVPPDLIFDQDLGSLFVIRSAGNLVDDFAYGSLEYAVKHLGVKFILVLGHTRCGVIQAFLEKLKDKSTADGHIEELLLAVYPAVDRNKVQDLNEEDLIVANVQYIVEKLKKVPPILIEASQKGELFITGALYDLDTGAVKPLTSSL